MRVTVLKVEPGGTRLGGAVEKRRLAERILAAVRKQRVHILRVKHVVRVETGSAGHCERGAGVCIEYQDGPRFPFQRLFGSPLQGTLYGQLESTAGKRLVQQALQLSIRTIQPEQHIVVACLQACHAGAQAGDIPYGMHQGRLGVKADAIPGGIQPVLG
jgi:hypothetical protein